MAIWPWYGNGMLNGASYNNSRTFLQTHEYKNLTRCERNRRTLGRSSWASPTEHHETDSWTTSCVSICGSPSDVASISESLICAPKVSQGEDRGNFAALTHYVAVEGHYLKLDLLMTQRRCWRQHRDLVCCLGELCHRFEQGRASQRPLSRFAPPFENGTPSKRLTNIRRLAAVEFHSLRLIVFSHLCLPSLSAHDPGTSSR